MSLSQHIIAVPLLLLGAIISIVGYTHFALNENDAMAPAIQLAGHQRTLGQRFVLEVLTAEDGALDSGASTLAEMNAAHAVLVAGGTVDLGGGRTATVNAAASDLRSILRRQKAVLSELGESGATVLQLKNQPEGEAVGQAGELDPGPEGAAETEQLTTRERATQRLQLAASDLHEVAGAAVLAFEQHGV